MKTFEGKNQNPRLFDQEGFADRKLGTANPPDIMGDEIGELSDLFHNVCHDGAPQIRLKKISGRMIKIKITDRYVNYKMIFHPR